MLRKHLMRVFQSYSSMFRASDMSVDSNLKTNYICAEASCRLKVENWFYIFKYASINLWFGKSEFDLLVSSLWDFKPGGVSQVMRKLVEWMLLFSIYPFSVSIPCVVVGWGGLLRRNWLVYSQGLVWFSARFAKGPSNCVMSEISA